MKIAFFTGPFPNLSETFILNQITGLLDRGHNVDIYSNKVGIQDVTHHDVQKYRLLDHTHYYANPSQAMPVDPAIRLIKGFQYVIHNFSHKLWPLIKSLNFFKFGREATSLGLFYKTIPFLHEDHSYDVIQCHFGPNGNLATKLRDVGVIKGKIVTTFHGYDITKYINTAGNSSYRILFRKGDLFLPISKRWQKELVRLGCPPKKIIVHKMGIDMKKFKYSPRVPDPKKQYHLLTVARLAEKKGVAYAIRSLEKVRKKFPGITYTIAGDGPLREELKRLIDRLNLTENVHLTGWINQDKVLNLMENADLLLAPSITDSNGNKEGIPVVLMEALAQGLPVISTWHSGIPELVIDNKSGYLVPEKDVDALSERIEYYLSHPQLWPVLGKNGHDFVYQNHNIDSLNNRLEGLFETIL